MAEFGNILFFIMSIVGVVTVGAVFLPYAAHSFLNVVEQTAAGNDEVDWPDEPFLDWLLKPFYLAWLLALWFALVWFSFLLAAPGFAQSPAGVIVALSVATWLFFPLSLFSVLAAQSPFIIFYPPLFGRLKGKWLAILICYGMTGALIAAGLGWVLLGLFVRWYLLPLGAFASMLAFLLYARVLGRLAWLIGGGDVKKGKAAKRSIVDKDSEGFQPGEFPAPLPRPEEEIPFALAIPDEPPPMAVELQEGIMAMPMAIALPVAAPPMAKLLPSAARSIHPETENEYVPVLDIEEVNEEPASVPTAPPLTPAPEDFAPLPFSDDEVMELSLHGPGMYPEPPADVPIPGLSDFDPDDPGLLPMEVNPREQPDAPTDRTPYRLQGEAPPSWRAEAAQATPAKMAPVEGYGFDPNYQPPAQPPILQEEPRPPARTKRPGPRDDPPPPNSLERTYHLRREQPPAPKHPFFQGVFEFPFYYRSLRALAYLTIVGLVELLFVKLMIAKWPVD